MDLVSTYLSYRLINLLAKPFSKWNAYKMGIIDDNGEIIKEPKTDKEKKSFSTFERIIWNIKKIIVKLTGKSRAAAILATLALLKEENENVYNEVYDYISKEILHKDLLEESKGLNYNEMFKKLL